MRWRVRPAAGGAVPGLFRVEREYGDGSRPVSLRELDAALNQRDLPFGVEVEAPAEPVQAVRARRPVRTAAAGPRWW